MSRQLFLDAHALLWFVEGNEKLSVKARDAIASSSDRLIVPAIALAECLRVIANRKSSISREQMLSFVTANAIVIPIDLDLIIAASMLKLPSEMHDQLLIACVLDDRQSRSETALITCDRDIRAAGLVDIIW